VRQQTETIEKSRPGHNIQTIMDVSTKSNELDKLRILIVDDDKQILSFVRFVLLDMGIPHVLQAESGKAALSFINNTIEPVDIIICDLMMPGMNGLDVLKFVRKTLPDLPFLMLTANGTLDALAVAKKAGVDAYIIKPFTPDDIRNKVRLFARRLLSVRSTGRAAC
jgi:two-component system chemotaxis response regulator CheY